MLVNTSKPYNRRRKQQQRLKSSKKKILTQRFGNSGGKIHLQTLLSVKSMNGIISFLTLKKPKNMFRRKLLKNRSLRMNSI